MKAPTHKWAFLGIDAGGELLAAMEVGGDKFGVAALGVSTWFTALVSAVSPRGSGVVPDWDPAAMGSISVGDAAVKDLVTEGAEQATTSLVLPISGKHLHEPKRLAAFAASSIVVFESTLRQFGEPRNVRDLVQVEMTRRFVLVSPKTTVQAVLAAATTLVDFALSLAAYERLMQSDAFSVGEEAYQ